VILQHGTILYRVDVKKMFSLLKVGKEKIADKLIAAVEERVTSVSDVCAAQGREAITREALYDALRAGFTEGKKFEVGTFSEKELARARELAVVRYQTDAWNRMR
jgi:lipoate-protein ligase A